MTLDGFSRARKARGSDTVSVKQESCAERVGAHLESRLADLRRFPELGGASPGGNAYIDLQGRTLCQECCPDDYAEYPSADLPIQCAECGGDVPDEDGSIADLGPFNEYGLAFDYVAPGTFTDQEEGFWRYQLSYGGPQEEFRFYSSDMRRVYRIEFWFLDWFDGASRDVTRVDTARALWDIFVDLECVAASYREAMED
jgi:hypothetical protein